MKLQTLLKKQVIFVVFTLFTTTIYSQNTPIIKYIDQNTIDEVKIDYDQDGDLDAAMSTSNGNNSYILQNDGLGNWTFLPILGSDTATSWDLEIADFNNDGWDDVFLSSNQE